MIYKPFHKFVLSSGMLFLVLFFFLPGSSEAADIGNCLMCHKYPGLSRVDEKGEFRLLFVNETIFNNIVHAKVKCEGCHPDIKKIPHEPAKKHENPLYRPLSFFKRVRPGISEAALGRCRVYHKSDEFIYRFYNHVTTRLQKTRNPRNIAETCGRCHDNPEIIARHDLTARAVFSYDETLHGKAAYFLDERIPDRRVSF